MPVVKMVSRRAIENFLHSSHVGVRRQWLINFPGEIDTLIDSLAAAGASLHIYESEALPSTRSFRVLSFLFVSLHSLATSSQLLISGLLLPAGNQLRSFSEALAMALLCSEPAERVLEEFDRDPKAYPVHKAPDRVLRPRTITRLGLSPSAGGLAEAASFYSKMSHASILAEAIVTSPLGYKLQVEFNHALATTYRRELATRAKAAMALLEVTEELTKRLS